MLNLMMSEVAEGWGMDISNLQASRIYQPSKRRYDCKSSLLQALITKEYGESSSIPTDIQSAIRDIAIDLWGGQDALDGVMTASDGCLLQGEMSLPLSIPYNERYSYFLKEAERGDARAQHSVGLLLWNGFGSVDIDPEESSKWHAAAAIQGNVDALAVLGGCIRTGTGIGKHKNIALGLKCIEYTAMISNPSGVNKKAALLESNDDWFGAARLYEQCYNDEAAKKNALLMFNLGFCLVNGFGVEKNVQVGESLWRESVDMAPDEGSEEASFFLYEQYERDDKGEARKWLEMSAELGYPEAVELLR
jgi:TPR repeat protein